MMRLLDSRQCAVRLPACIRLGATKERPQEAGVSMAERTRRARRRRRTPAPGFQCPWMCDQLASAARSPPTIFSAASRCIPDITWLAGRLQATQIPDPRSPSLGRLGNGPQDFAANRHSSWGSMGRDGPRWPHTGMPSRRPLAAVARVRIPSALRPPLQRNRLPCSSAGRRLHPFVAAHMHGCRWH